MNPSEVLKSDLMKWTTEVEGIATDALREVEKLLDALTAASRHFNAEAEMNAALHLTENVMPNPLAAKVNNAVRDGVLAHVRLNKRLMGEKELPFDSSD